MLFRSGPDSDDTDVDAVDLLVVLIADLYTVIRVEAFVTLGEDLEAGGPVLVGEVTQPHSFRALVMPRCEATQAARLAALTLALAGFELHRGVVVGPVPAVHGEHERTRLAYQASSCTLQAARLNLP